jgi:hypothetical protein
MLINTVFFSELLLWLFWEHLLLHCVIHHHVVSSLWQGRATRYWVRRFFIVLPIGANIYLYLLRKHLWHILKYHMKQILWIGYRTVEVPNSISCSNSSLQECSPVTQAARVRFGVL